MNAWPKSLTSPSCSAGRARNGRCRCAPAQRWPRHFARSATRSRRWTRATEEWKLPAGTDVVFLALHGTYGEDGTVQSRLEELGAVYTGCDPEASRIGFDKFLTKQRCVAAGVPTARFLLVESASASWPMGWDPPVVLKPVRQGSSVGLQFVERVSDWSKALAEAMRYDSQVLMEEKIAGRECTVGILGDKTPRRTGHDPGAQRRAVEIAEVRQRELGDEHRGNAVERRAALLLHRLERQDGIERAVSGSRSWRRG